MFEPEIEIGNSFAEKPPNFIDLRHRVAAAMRALKTTNSVVMVEEEDQIRARQVMQANDDANDELKNPAVVVHLKMLLSEYDREIVTSAATIRNYVTNRLIEESDNDDPRIRMRALELLGKISDVGLFTEKSEVTIRQRPTEELERLLRERLAKVINSDPTAPADHTEEVVVPIDDGGQ